MKTQVVFWLGLLSVLIIGCKKDPDPVEPPDTLPNIFMSPSTDVTVDHGDTCTFTWEVKGATDNFSTEISLGGEIISTENKGNIITPLSFSTTFVVHVTMDDGRTSIRTVGITVRPGVVFDPPKIFLQYATDSIQYDSSFHIEWTTEGATSVWLNDTVKVPVYGHFGFFGLKHDSLIRFRALGPGGITTDSVYVFVADAPPPPPINPNLEIVILHPWRMVQYLGKDQETDQWVQLPVLRPEDKNIFFEDTKNFEIYRNDVLLMRAPFYINDSIIDWFLGPFLIRELNKDTMKIEHKVPSGGQYDSVFRQEVYSHFL